MVSWRIREQGQSPVIGDIVRKKSTRQDKEEEKSQRTTDYNDDVEFITEDNISSYSITDVLLPLPGWDVKLPQNPCEMVAKSLRQSLIKISKPGILCI